MHLRSHVLLYFIDSLSQLFFYEMIFFNVITSKKLSKTKMDPEKMLEKKTHIMKQSLEAPCQISSSFSRSHESSETQGCRRRFNGKNGINSKMFCLGPWHWPNPPRMAMFWLMVSLRSPPKSQKSRSRRLPHHDFNCNKPPQWCASIDLSPINHRIIHVKNQTNIA
jgi:hypothetical protein